MLTITMMVMMVMMIMMAATLHDALQQKIDYNQEQLTAFVSVKYFLERKERKRMASANYFLEEITLCPPPCVAPGKVQKSKVLALLASRPVLPRLTFCRRPPEVWPRVQSRDHATSCVGFGTITSVRGHGYVITAM